jgi:hypothetical protein
MKICPVGTELFYTDRHTWTDMRKLTVTFHTFANVPTNAQYLWDLRFSQQCSRTCKSSGMWHYYWASSRKLFTQQHSITSRKTWCWLGCQTPPPPILGGGGGSLTATWWFSWKSKLQDFFCHYPQGQCYDWSLKFHAHMHAHQSWQQRHSKSKKRLQLISFMIQCLKCISAFICCASFKCYILLICITKEKDLPCPCKQFCQVYKEFFQVSQVKYRQLDTEALFLQHRS